MKLDGCAKMSRAVYCVEEQLYLSYHLLAHNGPGGRTVYDLMLEGMQGAEYDGCLLCDIATSLSMAEHILELFVKETVTPVTAQDILEELLSTEAFLYGEEKGG